MTSPVRVFSEDRITIDDIDILDPKKGRENRMMIIPVLKSTTNMIRYFEFAKSVTPYGINFYQPPGEELPPESRNYRLTIVLEDEHMVEFFNNLNDLTKNYFLKHYRALGFKLTPKQAKENAEAFLSTPLRVDPDEPDAPPKFSIKIMNDKENPEKPKIDGFYRGSTEPTVLESYDQLKSYVPPGTPVKVIAGIRFWCQSGIKKYGYSFTLTQLLVPKIAKTTMRTFAFTGSDVEAETKTPVKASDEHDETEDRDDVDDTEEHDDDDAGEYEDEEEEASA